MIKLSFFNRLVGRLRYSKVGRKLEDWFRRRRNRRLVSELPFLRPLDWNGVPDPNYDYTWTHLDNFPNGWRKTIEQHLYAIRDILVKYNQLEKFIIVESKEKWGAARIYYAGIDNNECDDLIDGILTEMTEKTAEICCRCGKKAVYQTTGWILPFCSKCIKKTTGRHRTIESIRK